MSLYTSPESKTAVLELYDQKLNEWPHTYSKKDIDSAFGQTRIIITGDPNKPPLVLVHGSNGCAPVALEVYPNLVKHFCVYAVDVLGQPNRSAEVALPYKGPAYGQWLNDVLEKLDLEQVVLLGFSLGGMIITKALIEDERRVKSAYLAASAGIVSGNPLNGIFKLFFPMKKYIKTRKEVYLKNFLEAMFTEEDLFALNFMGAVLPNYKLDFSPIPNLSIKEAKRIQTPISVIASAHDLLFPGSKMIKRSKKLFPNLQTTLLLPNAKHVPNAADNARIEALIFEQEGFL
ncbi:MAG: alpha/beta fold hydrolase [Aureispira sp.]